MVSFCSTHSKRLLAHSLRSRIASILCGILFLALSVNAAFADMNSAIDKLMSNAISESQRMLELMTASCPGGLNPAHYDEYVKDSNEVVKQLNEIKLGLAKGQTSNAEPQIDTVEDLLEKMIAFMHQSCPVGPHERDPFNCGEIINIKERVLGSLDAVKVILAS